MWFALSVAAGAAVLFGGVSLIVWQSLHPVRYTPDSTPQEDGIAYEDVTFASRDGLALSGWWIPAQMPRGTIILCHGYPAERHDLFPMLPFLHSAGYNVLAFDFRRLGRSAGDVSTVGLHETRDLAGAVDYAVSRSDRPIAALGWSMGAAVCLMQAAQDPRICAVVADSPYRSLDVQTRRRFGRGPLGQLCGGFAVWLGERFVKERLSDASPLESSRRLNNRPVLLIHSRSDRLIPVEDSEAIRDAVGAGAELWVTDASGHVKSYRECTEGYQQRVLVFLGKAMHR